MHKYNLMNKIKELPDLIRTNDLINLGIFTSHAQATFCRKKGNCPKYITLSGRRIVYTKEEVIDWLEKKISCLEV